MAWIKYVLLLTGLLQSLLAIHNFRHYGRKHLDHVRWADTDRDMFTEISTNLYAFKGVTESYVWHLMHAVFSDDVLSTYLARYEVICNSKTERSFSHLITKKEFDQCKKKLEKVLFKNFVYPPSGVLEKWMYEYHMIAYRGLIWGNRSLMDVVKRHCMRSMMAKTMFSVTLRNNGLPSYTEFKVRLAYFVASFQLYSLQERHNGKYCLRVEYIMRLFEVVSPAMTKDAEIRHIRRTSGSKLFVLKNAASSVLRKSAAQYRGAIVRTESYLHVGKRWFRFYVIFDVMLNNVDLTMFMIDTEPMKKILGEIFRTIRADFDEFKRRMISFLEELFQILKAEDIYRSQEIKLLTDTISRVCTYSFCSRKLEGFPDFWIGNRAILKIGILARKVVNKLPEATLSVANIERNQEPLTKLVDQYPAQILAIPNIYRTLIKIGMGKLKRRIMIGRMKASGSGAICQYNDTE